jgi:hypothetical protein
VEKRFVFWTPVDPCVESFVRSNESLHGVSRSHPYVFACSNGIDTVIRETCGNHALTINTENDMKGKGTAVFDLMKTMDFDICIRVDADAIIFDLPRLLDMASATGPKQLLGWEVKPGRVRGGCHAVGAQVVRNLPPLGEGPNFDKAMSTNTTAIGGEILHCKFFEMNYRYTGECPVWHPKKSEKTTLFDEHMEMWRATVVRAG